MAGTTIRELSIKLGFEFDEAKLGAIEKSIESLKSRMGTVAKAAGGIVAAATAAAAGLTAIAKSAANAGDDLDAQSSLFGFAVEQLQIWTRAAGYGDIATEEFTSSIQYLNRIVGDASRGQKEALKPFTDLGVKLTDASGKTRMTSDVMADLAERFSHIDDPAKRASLAMDLFGRGGLRMGRFLAESGPAIARATEIVQAFGFYTAESAAQADAANDALEDSATLIRGMKNEIGIGLLPVLKAVADRFNNWILANREIIRSKIDKFVTNTAKAFETLWSVGVRVFHWVESLVRLFGGLENVLKLIGVALLAAFGGTIALAVQSLIALVTLLGGAFLLAWAEALIVPALIAAGIALLILIIEDLYVWIRGGDSVIGDFLGSWVDFRVNALKEFASFFEGLGVIWDGIVMLFKGVWEILSGAFGIWVALWKGDMEGFKKSLKTWATGIADVLTSPFIIAFGLVETAVTGLVEIIKGAFKITVGLVQAMIPPSLIKLLNWVGGKAADIGGAVGNFVTDLGRNASQGAGVAYQAAYGISQPVPGAGLGGAGGPVLPLRPGVSGSPAGVSIGQISVGPTSVTLPAGTPEDHAKEMTRIFHANMEDAITHSLQMSARPGG